MTWIIITYLHPIMLGFSWILWEFPCKKVIGPLKIVYFVASFDFVPIPKTTSEAMIDPGWRQAMVDEMVVLHSNGT